MVLLFGSFATFGQTATVDSKPPALSTQTSAKQPEVRTKKSSVKYAKKKESPTTKNGSKTTKKSVSPSPTSTKRPAATKDSKQADRKPAIADGPEKTPKLTTEDKSPPSETRSESAPEPKGPPMGADDSIPFMNKQAEAPAVQPGSMSIWLKTAGSVILILGLLFVGTWVVKKTGLAGMIATTSDQSPELKILASVSPKSGQTISVVRFGDRTLLVGSTAQSFTLLADNEDADFEADDQSQIPFEYSGKPVTVSDMLAKEGTFENEFQAASNNLTLGLEGRRS